MFDPDSQRPILRLTAEPVAKPLTTSERLALAERQMEEAIARWSEAFTAWQSERAQAQPIPAAHPFHPRHSAEEVEHYSGTRWSDEDLRIMRQCAADIDRPAAQPAKQFHRLFDAYITPVGDGAVCYQRPAVFRADGTVEYLDGFQMLDAPV